MPSPKSRLWPTRCGGAQQASAPDRLDDDLWHLPYIRPQEVVAFSIADRIKISAARCARVSYLNHDGQVPEPSQDLALFQRLMGAIPIHASPAEHQACPDDAGLHPQLHGNFRGWVQHRKQIERFFAS